MTSFPIQWILTRQRGIICFDSYMIHIAHQILIGLYIGLPPAAIIFAILRARRSAAMERIAVRQIGMFTLSSLILGSSASIIYGILLGGTPQPIQLAFTCYWVASLLCLLRLFDWICQGITRILFGVSSASDKSADREAAANTLRMFLLFTLGLPYMFVVAFTYRPQFMPENISTWQDFGAKSVSFASRDGIALNAIWIPNASRPSDSRQINWAQQTIIMAADGRGNPTIFEKLSRDLLQGGYNLLIVQMRAQGQSAGQITTFGDLERLDILGAVQWLRKSNAAASKKIMGIGVGIGGAAILNAAADPSPEGNAISSVAVCGTFNRFSDWAATLVGAASDNILPSSAGHAFLAVAIPLADLQTGVRLEEFSPQQDALNVAPRPIMVIQGKPDTDHPRANTAVPYALGQQLFDFASAPKRSIWTVGSDEAALADEGVCRQIRQFVDTAVPMI
jgi:fermentation-respiration switch protein FrsA (DUF1100 family)